MLVALLPFAAQRGAAPSRFDSSFYRTHDPLSYIPSDAQSLKSQATYNTASSIPLFSSHAASGPFAQSGMGGGRKTNQTYSSYASSIISQDVNGGGDASSIADSASVLGAGGESGRAPSEMSVPSSIAFSQSDRLRRRLSISSMSQSDLGSMYKSDAGDDDGRSTYSAIHSQGGGFTEF